MASLVSGYPSVPLEEKREGLAAACLALPDVADALGAACCDPALLARLGYADKSLSRMIFSSRFAERRAQDLVDNGLAWAKGCESLEQLEIGFKVSEICRSDSQNHLYFEYGGGLSLLEETKTLIHAAALFAQQHPRLKFHADAHAGVGAPRGIATSTSRRRALSVVDGLTQLGVSSQNITSTSWGRRVSSTWLEPESSTAARAELYFSLDGQEFPARPEYYLVSGHGKDRKDEDAPESERLERSDFSDSEEEEPRRQRMLAMLRALGFPVQGAFQGGNVIALRREDLQDPSEEERDEGETES